MFFGYLNNNQNALVTIYLKNFLKISRKIEKILEIKTLMFSNASKLLAINFINQMSFFFTFHKLLKISLDKKRVM